MRGIIPEAPDAWRVVPLWFFFLFFSRQLNNKSEHDFHYVALKSLQQTKKTKLASYACITVKWEFSTPKLGFRSYNLLVTIAIFLTLYVTCLTAMFAFGYIFDAITIWIDRHHVCKCIKWARVFVVILSRSSLCFTIAPRHDTVRFDSDSIRFAIPYRTFFPMRCK